MSIFVNQLILYMFYVYIYIWVFCKNSSPCIIFLCFHVRNLAVSWDDHTSLFTTFPEAEAPAVTPQMQASMRTTQTKALKRGRNKGRNGNKGHGKRGKNSTLTRKATKRNLVKALKEEIRVEASSLTTQNN